MKLVKKESDAKIRPGKSKNLIMSLAWLKRAKRIIDNNSDATVAECVEMIGPAHYYLYKDGEYPGDYASNTLDLIGEMRSRKAKRVIRECVKLFGDS